MAKKQFPKPNVIKRKERHSFTKKFSAKEVAEKQNELSQLLTTNWNSEQFILNHKNAIKSNLSKAGQISKSLADGGEGGWEECSVEFHIKEKKKKYFFKNELVDEEDMDEDDL